MRLRERSLRQDPDLCQELASLARGCDFVLPSRFKKRLKAFQQVQTRKEEPLPPATSQSIPTFYFPRGHPQDSINVDAVISKIESTFARFPHERATMDDMGLVPKVINTLADHRHRGTDFGESPWLRIIIAFLRSYKVVVTLWTVYLWVSFLKTIFHSENGHDGSTDVQQRAWRSNRRRQE
ncbi:hypothetical protein CK820_G0044558, partial [Pan troglodytes]